MPSPLFYIFAAIMLVGGAMVVFMRNPVSSALSMVMSFLGLAAIFVGLNAYLIGVLQILVYAGAIMVLFIFIIMLLDLKKEEKTNFRPAAIATGIVIPLILIIQLAGVVNKQGESPEAPKLELKAAAANFEEGTMIHKRLSAERLPDTHLVGHKLYTDYNFPLQMIAVLLLVATIGCVTLSKKNTAKIANAPTQAPKPPAAAPKPAPQPQKEEATSQATGTTTDEKRGVIYTTAPETADDLKVISGVGPVLEQKLNDFGIYTYKQIADWTETNIAEFDELLSFKGRITREDWLTQAAELHAKKNA